MISGDFLRIEWIFRLIYRSLLSHQKLGFCIQNGVEVNQIDSFIRCLLLCLCNFILRFWYHVVLPLFVHGSKGNNPQHSNFTFCICLKSPIIVKAGALRSINVNFNVVANFALTFYLQQIVEWGLQLAPMGAMQSIHLALGRKSEVSCVVGKPTPVNF